MPTLALALLPVLVDLNESKWLIAIWFLVYMVYGLD
jgi:hypothetical protein